MGDPRPLSIDDHAPEVREPAGYRRIDVDVARELRERLVDDVGLDASGIEIEVKDGTVTMRGVVRQCADAKRAEAHACAILSVALVRNELRFPEQPAAMALEPLGGAAARMGKPAYER